MHTFFFNVLFQLYLTSISSLTPQGGNKGIGKETARRIGKEPNFTVLIACRNLKLGQEAVQDL